VFDGFEVVNRMADLFGLAADQHAYGNSGQHVFEVVGALKRNF
jgi:hypothetical protein